MLIRRSFHVASKLRSADARAACCRPKKCRRRDNWLKLGGSSMCGLAGILHRGRVRDAGRRIGSMAAAIRHRGPDDDGFFEDADISLGFRRLSIVDLHSGRQPMANEDGTVWVVFNGEIYNHRELRRELEAEGHRFKTDHSDTEVLVHGYEQWREKLLDKLNGMFAFAIWDQCARSLTLGRDRLGIKPLYIAETSEGSLLFASEIRALQASGLVSLQPDDAAVFAYFQNQNIWNGRSMFRGIRQLRAGHYLVDDGRGRREAEYWDFSFNRRSKAPAVAATMLRDVLDETVDRQIAADVPVMAYLSGGIDSTSLVAAAHRRDPKVRAYSCIFDLEGVGEDRQVDEREFSRLVANELAIEHVELELPQTVLRRALLPTVQALEEPRMGMAYVNYLIAGRVAEDSKVVLSGCGGDEMLGGYVGRYGYVGGVAGGAARSWWRRFLHPQEASAVERILPLYTYPLIPSEYDAAFTASFKAGAGDYSVAEELRALLARAPSDHVWDKLLYADAKTYLAGLLMVEDKVSMAHGLEARVPLLDNRIIDLATSFDWSLLTDGSVGKKVFRDAVRPWVPQRIADKPKMGFGPPDASWYRGGLRPFVEQVLAPQRVAARGVFNPDFVATALEAHMSGKANRLTLLWSLLSFEAWCEAFDLYGGDLGMPLGDENRLQPLSRSFASS
ncbi:asparagine synthase (glutamine-hydrolyzing) [Bradyrhizobium sp. UFLA 03-164]|uniref:asparagine synthase (glutamine-hydrolyzing) n=2 Tax=Bradyrhizobium uaiense TaxID=2594946 RepID=A0A6P1BF35_9BRAD|nr:asparagine synthase (glutamine-hydrolyzing) [Bradyrhizobium uaiense]